MGVIHFGDQLGGSFTATQSVATVNGSSILAVPSNGRRVAVTIQAGGGPITLGYGATAVAGAMLSIASGALIEESSFKAGINAVAASGVNAALFITDVYLP